MFHQKGGSSDFTHSFYAQTVVGGPAALTKHTLDNIDKSPMFNPLSTNTAFPTINTGIIPNGLYYAHGGNSESGEMFNVGKCSGIITRKGNYNFVIEGKCEGAKSGTFFASSPPDFRQSYSGSGLPFPNEEVAFSDTPNKGNIVVSNGSFKVEVIYPNSYYINCGTKLVPPQVCLKLDNCDKELEIVLSSGPFIPNRSLSSLPGRVKRDSTR